MQDDKWSNPNPDPTEDMLRTLHLDDGPHAPVGILCSKEEIITLKAADLYSEWKAKWRKQHKILSLLERISNKIRGIK